MSSELGTEDASSSASPSGQTVVLISTREDGTFQATQRGLDIYGVGPSAARATEDMACQIAEAQERGDL